MNVEREIAAANRRVRLRIEQMHDEALVRLGFDPVEERAKEEKVRYEAALRASEEAGRALRAQLQEMADAIRTAAMPFIRFVEAFQGGAR